MAKKPKKPLEINPLADTLLGDLKDLDDSGLERSNIFYREILDTAQEIHHVEEKRAKTLKNIGDILVDTVKLQEKLGKSTFQTKDLTDDIIEAKRQGNIEDERKLKLAQAQNRALEHQNNILMRQANLVKRIGNRIEEAFSSIPVIGGFISDILGATGLGERMSQDFLQENTVRNNVGRRALGGETLGHMIGSAAMKGGIQQHSTLGMKVGDVVAGKELTKRDIENEFVETGRNLNQMARTYLSPTRLGIMAVAVTVAAAATKGIRIGMEKGLGLTGTGRGFFQNVFLGKEADAFEAEFGKVNSISTMTAIEFKKMSFHMGLSAENAAKLSKELELNTDLTKEQSVDMLKTVQGLAKAAGVAPKAVFEDMARNADMFAQFSKEGATGLAEAAIKAKTLGLNLSAVSSISKSLLNFESSISAEFEAQVLTGKMLNLDTARRLALAGKASEMLDEIVRQVGGERELRSMNILALQSLATAVGLSAGELQRVAQGNEISAKNPVVSKLDETNEILRAQLDDAQRANLKNLQNQQLFLY